MDCTPIRKAAEPCEKENLQYRNYMGIYYLARDLKGKTPITL